MHCSHHLHGEAHIQFELHSNGPVITACNFSTTFAVFANWQNWHSRILTIAILNQKPRARPWFRNISEVHCHIANPFSIMLAMAWFAPLTRSCEESLSLTRLLGRQDCYATVTPEARMYPIEGSLRGLPDLASALAITNLL